MSVCISAYMKAEPVIETAELKLLLGEQSLLTRCPGTLIKQSECFSDILAYLTFLNQFRNGPWAMYTTSA